MNAVEEKPEVFDYIVIGSGFGGSVSAMRLSQKGYSVLVLERGKRFRDQDFAKSSWNISRYLWMPAFRCFGILQIVPFKDVFVFQSAGVGGGSLGYAMVLEPPTEELFDAPAWKSLADWKNLLEPHFRRAQQMLGTTVTPRLSHADNILKQISKEFSAEHTFRPTIVGAYFCEPGMEGVEVPDPYFAGEGPNRVGCTYCGACMIGCRINSKNTLEKNYLYFAEKFGAKIRSESEVRGIRALTNRQSDGARYEVSYRRSTAWGMYTEKLLRARNVVISAGAINTQYLLFRCRDIIGTLPDISPRLGDMVRTNSESLLGVVTKNDEIDYSKGIAISSIFQADHVTRVEPVRYPAGSSLMRYLSSYLVDPNGGLIKRQLTNLLLILSHFKDFLYTHILPHWAERTTILLIMQTVDNHIKMRLGRSLYTLFRKKLITVTDKDNQIPTHIPIGHEITRKFASRVDGIPAGTITEGVLNIPMTAHLLGGCPIGLTDTDGVVDLSFQVHNYPGLFVVDGSIVPANPGINPSLTITALAEYAMSLIPDADQAKIS